MDPHDVKSVSTHVGTDGSGSCGWIWMDVSLDVGVCSHCPFWFCSSMCTSCTYLAFRILEVFRHYIISILRQYLCYTVHAWVVCDTHWSSLSVPCSAGWYELCSASCGWWTHQTSERSGGHIQSNHRLLHWCTYARIHTPYMVCIPTIQHTAFRSLNMSRMTLNLGLRESDRSGGGLGFSRSQVHNSWQRYRPHCLDDC